MAWAFIYISILGLRTTILESTEGRRMAVEIISLSISSEEAVWSVSSLFAILTSILWTPAAITKMLFDKRQRKVFEILEHLPYPQVIREINQKYTAKCGLGTVVKVLKFRTPQGVACHKKGQEKQCRPRSDCFFRSSLIRVFPVCYSERHFESSSSDNWHFENRKRKVFKILEHLPYPQSLFW